MSPLPRWWGHELFVTIYLVEPEAGGRISGGYLYNQRIATRAASVERVSLAAGSLATLPTRLNPMRSDWVIADSLFLTEPSLQLFLELRRRTSCRLAVLLHAWPSCIARAASLSGSAPPSELRPTRSELELVAQLDAVVCPGPLTQRQLAEAGLAVPVLICPPGAPVPARTLPRSAVRAPLRLLSVSNVTRGKGLQDGVRVLASTTDEFAAASWRWEIVGSLESDPAWARELAQLVEELGLGGQISFSGALDPALTWERYRDADLFFLPSYSENYPLVLLEAQARALPSVAYASGGIPDIVVHEVSGLLAPLGDRRALGACLSRLLRDADLRGELGAGALGAAASRPGWEAAALHFEETLLANR